MTSWRYVPHFFLFVLLIDLSKEDCVEYFDFSVDTNLAHNLKKTFPLVKPKNTMNLEQYMICTLEKSKDQDKKFPCILEHCFELANVPAESCSNEAFGNISYYNLMCMTATALKPDIREGIAACHFYDYETLVKLSSLQYYATTPLPQTTLSPASPTSTSPTTKTTTTTTSSSETTQNMLPTTTTTTSTTSSKTTKTMLPTTKTTTMTTTTSSKTTQTMLPTTITTMSQKTNTRTPNKTPRLSPTSASTTKTTAAQPASHAVGTSDNSKIVGLSPTTQEDASPDNVLKYLLLSMSLILLLLTTVYLYKRLRTRLGKRRENNAESYSLPLEPITQPRVAERNEEEDTQLLDAHEYEHAIVDNNLQTEDTVPIKSSAVMSPLNEPATCPDCTSENGLLY